MTVDGLSRQEGISDSRHHSWLKCINNVVEVKGKVQCQIKKTAEEIEQGATVLYLS